MWSCEVDFHRFSIEINYRPTYPQLSDYIKKSLSTELLLLSDWLGWGTRTRTKNDRTRICSVTITPYPNLLLSLSRDNWLAGAKVLLFFELPTFFPTFLPPFLKKSQIIGLGAWKMEISKHLRTSRRYLHSTNKKKKLFLFWFVLIYPYLCAELLCIIWFNDENKRFSKSHY